jgi:hypothetical protein
MIENGGFARTREVAPLEDHDHIRELHSVGRADFDGRAAQRQPEAFVRLDIADVVVQVTHRDTCLIRRRQLCRGVGGDEQRDPGDEQTHHEPPAGAGSIRSSAPLSSSVSR